MKYTSSTPLPPSSLSQSNALVVDQAISTALNTGVIWTEK